MKTYENFISLIKKDIEIIIHIEDTDHSFRRKKYKNNNISDDDITEIVNSASDILIDDLISGKLKLNKAFVIKDLDINIVCSLSKYGDLLKLKVITVMKNTPERKQRIYVGQYVLDANRENSYFFNKEKT